MTKTPKKDETEEPKIIKKAPVTKTYAAKNFNTLEDVAEYLNAHPEMTKEDVVFVQGSRFPFKLLVSC